MRIGAGPMSLTVTEASDACMIMSNTLGGGRPNMEFALYDVWVARTQVNNVCQGHRHKERLPLYDASVASTRVNNETRGSDHKVGRF